MAIALASLGPIQIGNTLEPSFSWRITTGVFEDRSSPRLCTVTSTICPPARETDPGDQYDAATRRARARSGTGAPPVFAASVPRDHDVGSCAQRPAAAHPVSGAQFRLERLYEVRPFPGEKHEVPPVDPLG